METLVEVWENKEKVPKFYVLIQDIAKYLINTAIYYLPEHFAFQTYPQSQNLEHAFQIYDYSFCRIP